MQMRKMAVSIKYVIDIALTLVITMAVTTTKANNTTSAGTPACSISCEAVTLEQCQSTLSYQQAGFPNFLGHTSNSLAADYDNFVNLLVVTNCYEYTKEFLCGILYPQCEEDVGFILPSKTMCVDFHRGCGDLLESDNDQASFEIDCNRFPDPENAEPVCYDSLPPGGTAPTGEPTTTNSVPRSIIIIAVCAALGLILITSLVVVCIYYTRPGRQSGRRAKGSESAEDFL